MKLYSKTMVYKINIEIISVDNQSNYNAKTGEYSICDRTCPKITAVQQRKM
jgi:hypothetical protein